MSQLDRLDRIFDHLRTEYNARIEEAHNEAMARSDGAFAVHQKNIDRAYAETARRIRDAQIVIGICLAMNAVCLIVVLVLK